MAHSKQRVDKSKLYKSLPNYVRANLKVILLVILKLTELPASSTFGNPEMVPWGYCNHPMFIQHAFRKSILIFYKRNPFKNELEQKKITPKICLQNYKRGP